VLDTHAGAAGTKKGKGKYLKGMWCQQLPRPGEVPSGRNCQKSAPVKGARLSAKKKVSGGGGGEHSFWEVNSITGEGAKELACSRRSAFFAMKKKK